MDTFPLVGMVLGGTIIATLWSRRLELIVCASVLFGNWALWSSAVLLSDSWAPWQAAVTIDAISAAIFWSRQRLLAWSAILLVIWHMWFAAMWISYDDYYDAGLVIGVAQAFWIVGLVAYFGRRRLRG